MDGAIEIRPFAESDEPAVVALWGEVFPDPSPRNEPTRIIRRKLMMQRDLFFIEPGGVVWCGGHHPGRQRESAASVVRGYTRCCATFEVEAAFLDVFGLNVVREDLALFTKMMIWSATTQRFTCGR